MEQSQQKNNAAFMSLQHLVKVYNNGEKAVYDFNLDIEKNDFIVIVGPSGCGKSTTLRMLAGLEDISEGEVYLENKLLNYTPCKDRRMAIVFQSYALYPQMNVFDNIAFPLTINKFSFPVISEIRKADYEIRNILETIPFNKFIGVLYNVYKNKGRNAEKEENIANIFHIDFYSAQLLIKSFKEYKNETLESLVAKEAKIKENLYKSLKELVAAENERLRLNDIKLDDAFCELNADGTKKFVLRKMTSYEMKKKVFETAETLDLTPYLDKLPKELSGGQMQRVALGRAIVKDVPVFLMDEPLSNLDAKLRLTMRSEIVKLHNRINATTVYVTHDQTEAMTMATKIVVMSKGFVQQIGTPKEIYNNPVNIFVAKFVGSPAMNVFEMQFDKIAECLRYNDISIPMDSGFLNKFNEFYEKKDAEFEAVLSHYDRAANEKILKILSATGEHIGKTRKQQKVGAMSRIKNLFKKTAPQEEFSEEKEIARRKSAQIRDNAETGAKLLVGIRPERIKVEKCLPNKQYENAIIVNPTVCELLGSEYNVYFDCFGKSMTAQLDAKEVITTRDKIAVSFHSEDIYVFDPITGDAIV